MRTLWILGGLGLLGFTLCSPHPAKKPNLNSQPQLEAVREIALPVPSKRGSAAEPRFAARLAPDQSLLVLAAGAQSEWPLTRVKDWWTPNPIVDARDVPAWSAADMKSSNEVNVDLEVSPNGRYAVVIVQARWPEKSGRKPDTVITVVDLASWRVLGTRHTAETENTSVRGAWLANDTWLALQGFDLSNAPGPTGYRRRNRLIGIPDLALGPECVSTRAAGDVREALYAHDAQAEALRQSNDAACRTLLDDAGVTSMENLESRIFTGHAVPPSGPREYFSIRYDDWSRSRDEIYWNNLPFESAAHRWYELDSSSQPRIYELQRLDAGGRKELGAVSRNLTCGNPRLVDPRGSCGCRVEDVAESSASLLAYCRLNGSYGYGNDLGDYQWLAAFRADDLTDVGIVPLPNRKHTRQLLAANDGRAYILLITSGERLQVFSATR